MNILVTGHNGLLGPYIVKAIDGTNMYTCSRASGDYKVDLTNKILVSNVIKEIEPKVVIHCAAYTNVDKAEKEPEKAFLINRDATKNIVNSISLDCHFIYLSTDQVYGNGLDLHQEGDENPINIYGQSKWSGALEARKHLKTTILHTNMFGPSLVKGRDSFSDIIIKMLENNIKLTMYSDAYFSPLHFENIAYFINEIIKNNIFGTYNLGSRNGMSKEKFIKNLAKHKNLLISNASSIKSSSINYRAKRTLDLRMDVNKIEKMLKIRMPSLINEIKKI